MNPCRDKIGQIVVVGAVIAYGHALGRCAGLRVGKVLSLDQTEPGYMRPEPSWKATVIGVEDDWSRQAPQLCAKTGTLFFPNRWLVLDLNKLPESYRTLLDGFVWAKKVVKGARNPPFRLT